MIRRLFRDATIGAQVRKCAEGIVVQRRFAGRAPIAAFSLSNRDGEFEIVVVRKDGL